MSRSSCAPTTRARGSLALLALVSGQTKTRRWSRGIVLLGVFATALFYGDSMITPAVTVLSAVEGLAVAAPAFGGFVLPIAITILIVLFKIQRSGTERVGLFFGPVMLLYFGTIAVLGIMSFVQTPEILQALSPHHAVRFFFIDPVRGFLALGSVVLAVTGPRRSMPIWAISVGDRSACPGWCSCSRR